MDFAQYPSPNFSERRGGAKPDLIILHYTAMVSTQAALDRLCDADREVSAHYLISETGDIYRLVDESMRAWHAGAGAWGSCRDVNSASFGIELANDGCSPFAAAQIDGLEELLRHLMDRWGISPERVIGHSDMAFARKGDPGARFDWRRLALGGLSVWPMGAKVQAPDRERFSEVAQAFGYAKPDDVQTLLDAFRLRFRPHATGALDGVDMAMIADLAQRYPVDRKMPTA